MWIMENVSVFSVELLYVIKIGLKNLRRPVYKCNSITTDENPSLAINFTF